MPLTDAQCRNAKTTEKQKKLSDGGGLTLLVKRNGSKLWQYRFRWAGKENVLSIGEYPEVSLVGARTAMLTAKQQLKTGINPSHAKQAQKIAMQVSQENTFKAIAESWLETKQTNWASATYRQCRRVMDQDLLPTLGRLPIRDVKPPQILAILKEMESRGAETLAIMAQQWIASIFNYAGRHLLVDHNPTTVLRGLITRPDTVHRTPLTKANIAELAGKLENYNGNLQTVTAIKMLLHTFVRTVEIRQAKWEEFDLESAKWVIPASRMKKRITHIVPLSRQVLTFLKQLQKVSGNNVSGYLFPNTRNPKDCMSATTVNRAMEYMGFAGKGRDINFTGHSFRATASTILNELGYSSDVIEKQMAHTERNRTRASYNHATYLPQRVEMMQAWSDLMDEYSASYKATEPSQREESLS